MKKTVIASVLSLGMALSVQAKNVLDTAVAAGHVKTVLGSELSARTTGVGMVDGAKVFKTDIAADNHIIHVIDTAVMPK